MQLVLRAIAQGKFPQKLYKYRDKEEYTDKIFESASIWFPAPNSFNDPFDCNLSEVQHHSDADAKNFQDHILMGRKDREDLERRSVSKDELVNWMKIAKTKVLNETGVLCMARTFDNVLMWSHYAQDHKGLVIEFDLEADPEFFTTPINVTYSLDYEPTNYLADQQASVDRIISTKSKAWDYEGEVRILKPHTTGLVTFKPRAIKRVIFGCRADDMFIDKIMSICRNGQFRHVQFAKMKTAYGRFALQLETLAPAQPTE